MGVSVNTVTKLAAQYNFKLKGRQGDQVILQRPGKEDEALMVSLDNESWSLRQIVNNPNYRDPIVTEVHSGRNLNSFNFAFGAYK